MIIAGFEGETTSRDLSRAEILKRGLPNIWHTEFQADFICNSNIAGRVVIPKGFISDGASIPRPIWGFPFIGISDTDPVILYPSFVHDLLYSIHGRLPDRTISREDCDNVIREQMKAIGAARFQYDGVYHALHLFGWHGWNKDTPPHKLQQTPYKFRPAVRFA